MGAVREDLRSFMIESRWFLLRMRNVLDKSCGENKTRSLSSVTFFLDNRTVYEIAWEKYGRSRQATDDMRT
jgi:hypothetical protein